ncbi:MFS transporter [Sphingobium sp. TB-6]|uniref:spinster family MFS transporter n=1 Tax=Sphingobium sp. TB-6 TaxID=2728850 RepID=UPI00146AC56F|nr:MFS transporter [Sphingobium sp. TB-6]NML91834.1 MFS transporter [Sphingobium sp. TB-6]
MTSVFVINFMDRQILSILLPQIKAEFFLENWQLGVLTGPMFGIMYSVSGLPIAVLSDSFNRIKIISASLISFSLLTMISGFCVNFWQLCVARFGVGVGEAGTTPAISSLMADLYPPQQRASAMAIYASGLNIGILAAFFLGGAIADHFGWRTALVAVSIPGLLLSIIIFFTVNEPQRTGRSHSLGPATKDSWFGAMRTLLSTPWFRWLMIAGGMASWSLFSILAFSPLFLTEKFQMSATQIGLILALLNGVGGGLGTFMAGRIADRLVVRGPARGMFVPAVALAASTPFLIVYFLAGDVRIAIAAAAIPAAVGFSLTGPSYATLQTFVPAHVRAQAIAIFGAAVNLMGLGLGPPVIGAVSDLLEPYFAERALGLALTLTAPISLLAALCYVRVYFLLRSVDKEPTAD